MRTILQTCAVLGNEFSLHDIVQVHADSCNKDIEDAVIAAVHEGILLEEKKDTDEGSEGWLSIIELEDESETIPCKVYQFRHHAWQKCILKTMLKERKLELHRMIAKAIEADGSFDTNQVETYRLLQLFEHWKLCGDFNKAAPLALAFRSRMEEVDCARQSLDMCNDALSLLDIEPNGKIYMKGNAFGKSA